MKIKKRSAFSFIDKYFSLLTKLKRSDRLFLQVSLAAFVLATIYFLITLNNQTVTNVPVSGGTIAEGVIGTPRFVNPVLATTKADKDMVALVYSGLVKLNANGDLVPDLAESITVSEDGRTYNIKLREDAYFHSGNRVTAKDVAYTIALIQNPDLKSPLRGNWDGVLVEELGDNELNIVIKEAYTPFLENLTVGILPRDIWDELPTEQLPFSQNNTEPIGSGLYQIVDVSYTKSGLISSYELKASDNYQAAPKISSIIVKFYQSEESLEEALESGEISSTAGLLTNQINQIDTDDFTIAELPLPRTFAIYFNQNKSPALRNHSVRKALDVMIDKDELINEVLGGYGIPAYGPAPAGFITASSSGETKEIDRLTKARSLLTDGGWSQNEDGRWTTTEDEVEIELTITISTANTPLFETTANYIKGAWEELGVNVNVSQFEQTDLVQGVIRPRDFQALLFGVDMGRAVDLYPFWHSSQKNDPGLNIAGYANIDADALLSDSREAISKEEREKLNQQIINLIEKDNPAVFLFTPTYGYVYKKELMVSFYPKMSSQSERFNDIGDWYIASDSVWPIFSNKED